MDDRCNLFVVYLFRTKWIDDTFVKGMINMDIQAMQAEVLAWAVTKGWEPDLDRKFADECALLHSEVSEILEAWRTRKLEPYTDSNGKPDDVASEFADVLIRLLHYSACNRFSLGDTVTRYMVEDHSQSIGLAACRMHHLISKAFESYPYGSSTVDYYMKRLLSLLLHYSELYGFDLEAEYHRKMDYNYTRTYRHGNKAM